MIEVTKGGVQLLENLSSDEMVNIKKELTLDNPAYLQVKKYSNYNYTKVPPYLTYYNQIGDKLIVPRGYKIPFKHKVIGDTRVSNKVLYPKFRLTLRDAQMEAYEAWSQDKDNGVLVLPTGMGKSILGCYIAYKTKQRALIVVQKNDLVTSWTKDIELCFGITKDKVGIIKAGKFKIGNQFTITTIQTLSKLSVSQQKEIYNTFGIVIQDEAHHSVAKSYNILKLINAKHHIALTATDMRTDGLIQVLYWMFGDVAYRGEVGDSEDIMPYSVIVRESAIKYNPPTTYMCGMTEVDEETASKLRKSGKRVKRKPINIHELREVLLNDKGFNTLVAKDIINEYKAKKACVAFFHTKEHVRAMKEVLINLGVPRGDIQLFYGDSKEDESILMKRAENKEVLITLATYSKLGEGTNIKSLERGFLVTSVNNEVGLIQCVGRLRRTKEGKRDVIIYDYHHKDIVGLNNHIHTRLKVYNQHGAKVTGLTNNRGTITRGYKRGK